MANGRIISARIEAGLVREIEETADADGRSRNQQLSHLVRAGLEDRARRQELEAEARAAADAAARAHLREHARLGGFQPKEEPHG